MIAFYLLYSAVVLIKSGCYLDKNKCNYRTTALYLRKDRQTLKYYLFDGEGIKTYWCMFDDGSSPSELSEQGEWRAQDKGFWNALVLADSVAKKKALKEVTREEVQLEIDRIRSKKV